MYDYIKGTLTNKYENSKNYYVTIESCGVGYCLETTYRDYNNLNICENEIKIFVSLTHKEDKMSLSGFSRREDRDMFNVLTSVSGVGVKMALALLNSFSASDLISLVLNEDYKSIMCAKGVGQKLAQKIILELKGKLNEYKDSFSGASGRNESGINSDNIREAQNVLLSLGYEAKEISSALKNAQDLLNKSSGVEDILKKALQILSV